MQAILTSKGRYLAQTVTGQAPSSTCGDRVDFVSDEVGCPRLLPMTKPITRLKGMTPPPDKPLSLDEMDSAIASGASRK
jgi:antitoxin PrlF